MYETDSEKTQKPESKMPLETMTHFILLGSQITADRNWNHEIKRGFLLRIKAMTNLDCTLKIRDFADKSPSNQSYGLSDSHGQMWEFNHKQG